MIIARQSTARTMMVGPVLDADGVAVTDCVVADFEGSVNGGDPAALNGSATLTHRGVGFYSLALTATDLATVGQFEVTINDTTNCCPMKEITVVEEAVYDAFYAASAVGYVASATGLVDTGTAQSVSSSTIVLRSAAAFVDDALNGCTVLITNGTQVGERAIITDYDGATDTATVTWPAATPSGTPTYAIYGSAAGASLTQIAAAILDSLLASYTVSGSVGERLGRIPNAVAGASGGMFIAGTNAATTITTGLTTTFTGNVTGSVASVTGAVGSVTGNVGGNVAGSVGSVTGAVGSVTGNVGGNVAGNVSGNVTGSIGSLAAQAKTDVNAEVFDVLVTDTFAEPSTVPTANSSLKDKLGWLFILARNKINQTSTTQTVRNDGDTSTVGTSTVSDDGVTGIRGKFS